MRYFQHHSPVGVDKMLWMFPRVKQSVITMIKPIVPLTTTPNIIACGRVFEASLISSAEILSSVPGVIGWSCVYAPMCTAQSNPVSEGTTPPMPTMTATPVLLHPPPLLNVVKTLWGSDIGARTQRGMMMTKNPMIYSYISAWICSIPTMAVEVLGV